MNKIGMYIIAFLGLMIIVGATLVLVKAQVGGMRIDPYCGSINAETIYAYNIYNGFTNYRAFIIAGDCKKIFDGRVEATSNLNVLIEADIRNKIRGMYLSPDGFGELNVSGRGRFTI